VRREQRELLRLRQVNELHQLDYASTAASPTPIYALCTLILL
jgi:hypothetical protein